MDRDYRGKEGQFVKDIINGDKDDIECSQYLFVNAIKPSWGTAMEVFYAHSLGKEIVTVCPVSNPSPWLIFHSTIIVKDFEKAIELFEKLYRRYHK